MFLEALQNAHLGSKPNLDVFGCHNFDVMIHESLLFIYELPYFIFSRIAYHLSYGMVSTIE
jgi:hypothetical protein